MESVIDKLFSGGAAFTAFSRLVLPVLAVIILWRCCRSLFLTKRRSEVWGTVTLPNGAVTELCHWENILGRAGSSDVVINYPTVSRSHAALIRDGAGEWTVTDLGSKSGTYLRGKKISGTAVLRSGDLIDVGGVSAVFTKSTLKDERRQAAKRLESVRTMSQTVTLFILSIFIAVLCAQLCLASGGGHALEIVFSFSALLVLSWCCLLVNRVLARTGFELETAAFFLCAIGFSVAASSAPDALYKLVICLVAGLMLFWLLGWFLRDLKRAKVMRWPIAAAGLLLLMVNLLLSESVFGAKNWLSIGGVSFQPSELVKICFVFAGAATLDRLFAKRNLVMFVAFAAACVGCLVLMSDFGTALVFFTAYLVIAFMRSGSFAAILLSGAGAAFAAFIAVTARPYIAARFSTWGRAWEFYNEGGYQQTRTMAACASGGLFGLGAGNGWLKNVFAADTDMVFGVVTEELGLIVSVTAVAVIVLLGIFAASSVKTSRSTFYAIGACAASSIFMMQLILNVFGSLDILPFTGVTFPFVSKGGSSLIASWGLLAFLKAADTRPNASFAIRLPKPPKRREKEAEK